MKNTITAMEYIIKGEQKSIITNRKNWVVITHGNKAFLFPYGQAEKRGLLDWSFSAIVNYKISFSYFTYKKDALKLIEEYEKNGYKIEKNF